MKYRDLKLTELREKLGLDYVAFTYTDEKCSCCYTPLDLKEEDWSPKTFERAGVKNLEELRKLKDFKYTYIQFANSDNGSGEKDENDYLAEVEYIRWDFEWDKMDEVIRELEEAFGDDYLVVKPENDFHCIVVYEKDTKEYENYMKELETKNGSK